MKSLPKECPATGVRSRRKFLQTATTMAAGMMTVPLTGTQPDATLPMITLGPHGLPAVDVADGGTTATPSGAPTGLSTEFIENPLAIDQTQPRLSWVVNDTDRGEIQTGYQILVASSRENINRDIGDVWNSGKIDARDSTAVKLGSLPLAGDRRYWWKVRTWDKDEKAGPYSWAATFDVGLKPSDWTAKFIWDGTDNKNNYAYFRRVFTPTAGKGIHIAKVYVSAHNVYRLFLDGRELGYGPARSNPFLYGQYNAYDVTDQLTQGSHGLAAMCHWQGTWGDSGINAAPAFIAELRVTYADGTQQTILSDRTWKALARTPYDESNPVLFGHAGGANNRSAEKYDARKEPLGWMKPDFDDAAWISATEVERDYKLYAQISPRSRIQHEIAPISIIHEGDLWKVDFGKLMYAVPRVTMVANQPGDVVTFTYFDDASCKNSLEDGWDQYTCRGNSSETYEKWNGWGGIRSMSIHGYRGELSADNVRALIRYSEGDKQGEFHSSDQQLNAIYGLCEWTSRMATQEGGFFDDDSTEQSSWGCDGYTGGRNLFYSIRNYRVQNKTLRDYAAEQAADGMIYACSPAQKYHLPDFSLNLYQSAWEYHLFYNDLTLLEDVYPALKKFLIEFLGKHRDPETGLSTMKGKSWEAGYSTSDWNPDYLDSSGAALTVHNMLYYHALWIMSQFARQLDRPKDVKAFDVIAAELKAGINAHLFDGVEKYRDGLGSKQYHLLCSVWAIHNDLVPVDKRDAVLKYIRTYPNYGLELASIGQCVFFDTMYPLGTEGERLLAFLKHPQRWVRMIPNYCTTELVDGGGIPLAVLPNAPATVLPKFVGGVRPTNPGFSAFDIKPTMDGLQYASVKVPTVKGMVSVEWRQTSDSKDYTLMAAIPVNSVATVYLPKQGRSGITIREGDIVIWQAGKFVRTVPGIDKIVDAGLWINVSAGSGTYRFTVQK